jgi:hypothetical protein
MSPPHKAAQGCRVNWSGITTLFIYRYHAVGSWESWKTGSPGSLRIPAAGAYRTRLESMGWEGKRLTLKSINHLQSVTCPETEPGLCRMRHNSSQIVLATLVWESSPRLAWPVSNPRPEPRIIRLSRLFQERERESVCDNLGKRVMPRGLSIGCVLGVKLVLMR